jgi:hypothetical protein
MQNFVSISFASVTMRKFLFPLTIPIAGSDLPCIPPAGLYLCYSLVTPSVRRSLSLCQGGCFETPHKQTLQADVSNL